MQYTSREVYEFISKQTNDPIVERKTCAVSGQPFPIMESDQVFFNTLFGISTTTQIHRFPLPKKCPEEMMREIMLRRNESKLKRITCAVSGKSLITIFDPHSPIIVWDSKIWWSDRFDGCEYGKDFDFSTTFTDNFKQLLHSVPFPNLYHTLSENSDYCNHTAHMKNCYMTFASFNDEDTFYSSKTWDIKDSSDLLDCSNSAQCYECVNTEGGYNLQYCFNTINCRDSKFLFDCQNCSSCVGCRNLQNKQYYIFNKQYTKETYVQELKVLESQGWFALARQRLQYQSQRIVPQYLTTNCEGVIGDKVTNSSHCFMCFNIENMKNCKRCENGKDRLTDTCYAFGCGINSSKNYQVIDTGGNGNDFYNTIVVHYCDDVAYSINCHNSQHLFGCIGLRNKSYCIFNKQYTKEEYYNTLDKIITHMQETGERGEFFHPSLSPFGYNETVAHEYYPLTKEESLQRGYNRQEYDYAVNIPDTMKVISSQELPLSAQTDEPVTDYAIRCNISQKLYRIIQQELVLYRKHNLPLPRKHPDIRHAERFRMRPGRVLYLRTCDHCQKEMLSVYDKNYNGKVYCEACYQKEVYS